MEFKTDFDIGQNVFYLARQHSVPCWLCEGTGKKKFYRGLNKYEFSDPQFRYAMVMNMFDPEKPIIISAEHECPHCGGKGRLKPNYLIYGVKCGKIISMTFDKTMDDEIAVFFVQTEVGEVLQFEANQLYAEKSEASRDCVFLNLPRLNINAERIHITEAFARTIPNTEKLNRRLEEFKKNGKCDTEIFIKSDGTLFDGYTSYLIYRMMGKEQIPVVVVSDHMIKNFKIVSPRLSKSQLKRFKDFKFPALTNDDNATKIS